MSLIGPTGSVGSLTVTGLSDVTYEVAFTMLCDAGQYQLLVGPEIMDLAGNLLDQDKDGTEAENRRPIVGTSFTVLETWLRLDFGEVDDAGLAAGYRRVVETDLYAASVGYGWQDNTMKSYDRTSGGDLLRDFHYAPQGTFLVDLPNGHYEVVLSMGDAGALHDQMAVFLEGTQVDTVSTAAGKYAIKTYSVVVNDGQLTLQLVDQGGTNANVVINALEITYQAGQRRCDCCSEFCRRRLVCHCGISVAECQQLPTARTFHPKIGRSAERSGSRQLRTGNVCGQERDLWTMLAQELTARPTLTHASIPGSSTLRISRKNGSGRCSMPRTGLTFWRRVVKGSSSGYGTACLVAVLISVARRQATSARRGDVRSCNPELNL